MRNPDSRSVASYFGKLAEARVRDAIFKWLAVLFAALAIALGIVRVAWPQRPARFYVPEAR